MRRDEMGRGGAHLIPDGAEGRRVPVRVPVGGGVELARDGERRGVAGGLPHPVPVRRRLLSRRRRRRRCRRLLHLYSLSGADDGRTDRCRRRRRSLGEVRGGNGLGARRVACTPILTAFSGSGGGRAGARFLFLLLLVSSGSAHAQWPVACPRVFRMLRELPGTYARSLNLPGVTCGVHGWPTRQTEHARTHARRQVSFSRVENDRQASKKFFFAAPCKCYIHKSMQKNIFEA